MNEQEPFDDRPTEEEWRSIPDSELEEKAGHLGMPVELLKQIRGWAVPLGGFKGSEDIAEPDISRPRRSLQREAADILEGLGSPFAKAFRDLDEKIKRGKAFQDPE